MSQTTAMLKPLAWTDPAPPNETGCRYDHVTAETPLGQLSIEWKSWKANDRRDLYLAGEHVKSCDDLDEAKQAAADHMASLVGACLIELTPEKFEQFEKALDANPMAENGALQALLARPKRWAGVEFAEPAITYSSTQSTRCAGCGERKHTPLRVDGMGGYVCLTCIDKRLGELLAEESARHVEKDWDGCQEVADLPAVHEALSAFSADSTGDAGVAVVQAVIAALELKQAPQSLELTDDVRWILGQMCFQHIHTAQALRVMGYQIARKAEDEQAVTLHWLLTHYLRDPTNWRDNASAELKAGAEAHKDK